MAVFFGATEASLALFGFGMDSFVEVGAAVIVLWRLRSDLGEGAGWGRERERRGTLLVGVLLTLLGVGVGLGAVGLLIGGGQPDTTIPGAVIAGVSLVLMVGLWRGKAVVARRLDSRTLEADAACARGCLMLSIVLLAGSLLDMALPTLWWADGVAALVLAVLIGREGIQTVQAARRPDFTGGCGCH